MTSLTWTQASHLGCTRVDIYISGIILKKANIYDQIGLLFFKLLSVEISTLLFSFELIFEALFYSYLALEHRFEGEIRNIHFVKFGLSWKTDCWTLKADKMKIALGIQANLRDVNAQ